MTSNMHIRKTTLRLAIACLSIAVATAADAATVPTPATTTQASAKAQAAGQPEELEQLDEIQVQGKRLLAAIADAEDDFYQLYNKLNTNHDYDTNCVYLNLSDDHDSRIKSRTCLPGFVADAMADQVYFSEECKAGQDADGNPQSPPPCYTPPPPQLLIMERSNEYARNMMKVINSDMRLQKMAGHLGDLYAELHGVQNQYVKVRSEDQPEKTDKHNLGPRIH